MADDKDTFKILVCTDVHLGYEENDPIRGNDSVVSFEEILSIARKEDVDFILHGGDLFHHNKPSRTTLYHCSSLLRKYCLGDKPIHFEYISDQSIDFKHCKFFPTVNYEDPNINVSIPLFSIHGNHDDPSGPGNLCSLDVLHTNGLVNYFGKATSLDKIQISPLLLRKGETKLALYGLGSIRDERLHRMFLKKDVKMLRPREDQESWFNIFCLHQNRAKHSATGYIPEQFLEDFLDLVIWGHEHECRLNVSPEKVEWNPVQKLYVCQPGSSIATSLSEGEKVPKHVGLLEVNKKDFRMQSIPLKSVRQLYMEDVVLSKHIDLQASNSQKKCEDFCKAKIEELIEKAEREHSGSSIQPKQPLIRLRVDYSRFETFSSQRFGQNFVDRVANPKNIIQFHRHKEEKSVSINHDPETLAQVKSSAVEGARVEDMVAKLVNAEGCQLKLLSERGMGEAVKEYVDKEEKEAITELVKYQLKKTQKHLQSRKTTEDNIDTEVVRFKEQRRQKTGEEEEEVKAALKEAQTKRQSQELEGYFDDEEAMDANSDEETMPAPSGRGRGGRGSRGGTRGRGRGRAKAAAADKTAGSTSGRGRGRGKQAVADFFTPSQRKTTSGRGTSESDSICLDESDDERETMSGQRAPSPKRKHEDSPDEIVTSTRKRRK